MESNGVVPGMAATARKRRKQRVPIEMKRKHRRTFESRRCQCDDLPRHPDFDIQWKQYERMVWGVAGRMARRYGGFGEEYVGSLLLCFNKCLHYYDSKRGCLTTLFYRMCDQFVWRTFLRYDRQSRYRHFTNEQRRRHDTKLGMAPHFGPIERTTLQIGAPVTSARWEKVGKSLSDLITWMQQRLPNREVSYIVRISEGETLRKIAQSEGISSVRVGQIVARAKSLILQEMPAARQLVE